MKKIIIGFILIIVIIINAIVLINIRDYRQKNFKEIPVVNVEQLKLPPGWYLEFNQERNLYRYVDSSGSPSIFETSNAVKAKDQAWDSYNFRIEVKKGKWRKIQFKE